MKTPSTLLLLAALTTAPAVRAAETREVCPVKIRVESGRVASADQPARFQSSVDATPQFLTGLNVYDGPPERGAALMPAQSNRGGARSTWRFPGDYPDGKWLSCDYAHGLIHMSVRADDASKSCEGVLTTSGDPRVTRGEFVCR